MTTYSVAQAKSDLSKLIDLALAGERVTITRDGAPVVELRPAQGKPRVMTAEALAALRAARERVGVVLEEDAGAFVSRMRDADWDGR
jgi:antitoxin (DNA-binding transcriptional repressor) of toxin-antitoxin stability system